ncbi:hypothetical protein [Sphingomonas panni]|uniref:hypothetical protein n=1 Tax=Sphingomonas panni TaxID=237612 RepID=UPI001F5B6AD1|nr:hypothetical protein [Sphingomonas panni]
MTGVIVLPGPEAVVLFGVHLKVLSALFGVVGVSLGHLMAPVAPAPLGWRRHSAVIAAGVLLSVGITIATGQRPLMVLGWSIGIGFSGITIFQTWAAQAAAGAKSLGHAALDELTQRIAARKDKP